MNWTKRILVIYLIWRILLFIPLYFSHAYLPYKSENKDVQLWAYTRPYKPVDSIFLYPWANFDGVHYLTIAEDGYRRGAVGRFFPFYPILIYGFSLLFGNTVIYGATEFFVAFFISNISFPLSLMILYKLIRIDYSENIALWSIIFLLLFPTSFFFVSIYSESLFLLLSLLSLYNMRSGKIFYASVFGFLLTLTRIVGIVILIPLLYTLIIGNVHAKKITFKESATNFLPILIVPLGLLGFMYYNYLQWHDFLYFIHAQQTFAFGRSHLIFFIPQTIFRYIKILIDLSPHQFEWSISLLEVSLFIIVTILLYRAWKIRIHTSYLLFSLGCFLLPSFSGTFSGLPRYVSILFPIFIVLALIKNTLLKIGICIFGGILLFFLLMFFSRGYFIA